MPMWSAGKASRRHGFTLIEMVVVVSIIGVLLAVAAPTIGASLDSVRMTTASNDISSFLNSAVNHAERRQQPVLVVIEPKKNLMAAWSNEPGYTAEASLPDGVRIEAVLPETQDEPDAARRVLIMPGATVPGIGIQFGNQRGARRIVRLDPMTGSPRVEKLR
jgi:prepilin-type N-terminal cleavage/methylation domain-containing protein